MIMKKSSHTKATSWIPAMMMMMVKTAFDTV